MKKIRNKILLTFMLTTAFLVILTGIYNVSNLIQLNDEEREAVSLILSQESEGHLKEQVESAVSLVEFYADQAAKGQISETEAKQSAKEAIKALRYAQDGYFWIDDTKGNLIAHPMSPENEGNNRLEIKDPKGTMLIQNIIQAAQSGDGYSTYQWEKPDAVNGELTDKRVYSQLYAPWGWIISSGVYFDSFEASIQAKEEIMNENLVISIIAVGVGVVVSLIASLLISLWLSRKISAPIIRLTESFAKDDEGRVRMQEVQVESKDEIGQLALALNVMSKQVREFIESVDNEAVEVVDSSKLMDQSAQALNQQMLVISRTTEDMAGGMEETAASCEEMNATTEQMENVVNNIVSRTKSISQSADEMADRSVDLKNKLTSTNDETQNIIKQTRDELIKSIEESKAVNEIHNLADVILQITEQTNLLALNANIEAARAGTAGLGFSVVAEEIRKLAENSKGTASNIQQVIKDVTQSVEHLTRSSTELLEFVESKVTEDYTFMLNSSEYYREDTFELKQLIGEVQQTINVLSESMGSVSQAIEEITASANEGAVGTTEIAESVSSTKHHVDQMSYKSDVLKNNAENLKKLLEHFKL